MERMRRWLLAALCMMVSAGGALAGEGEAAEAVPPSGAAVVARARGVARLTQDLVTGIEYQGQTQEIKGRMWKNGAQVRFEISMPTPNGELTQYAAFDGQVFATYLPAPVNIAQKIDFSEVQKRVDPKKWALFNRARALAVESDPFLGMDLGTLAFLRDETLDGAAVQVFGAAMEPLPDDFRSAFPYVAAKAEIWVAPADGLPRRVIHFTDVDAKILSHTFRNVVVAPELDASLFALEFPKDTKVDDATRQIVLKLTE